MRERFSSFIRMRVGIVVFMFFMANMIMFSAIMQFNGSIPSEEVNTKASNLTSIKTEQGRINRDTNNLHSKNGSFKPLEKNKNSRKSMTEKRKFDLKFKGQMDYVPVKRMFNEERDDGKEYTMNETKALSPHLTASKLRKKNAIDQINALANANSNKVYNMYDDTAQVEKVNNPQGGIVNNPQGEIINNPQGGIVNNAHEAPAVKSEQDANANQKVPSTFNEKYIKYFWNHPKFHKKYNYEKKRGETGYGDNFNDESDKVMLQENFEIMQELHKDKQPKGKADNLRLPTDNKETESNHTAENIIAKEYHGNAQGRKEVHADNAVKPKMTKEIKKISYMTIFPAKGQLGNQMFQLASLLGIADLGNFTPFLPMSVFDLNKIFIFPQGFSRDIDITAFRTFSDSNHTQDTSIKLSKTLDIHRNWSLDGYFQSFMYFNKVSSKVREYFKFHKHLLRVAVGFILQSVPTGHIKIAIHIRRGDFIHSYQMKLGRVAAPPEYVHRAMQYFQSKYVNVTFIVVSDDMKWCKEYIKGDNVVYSTSHYNDKGIDLAIISKCDHVIISVGTFGWWGAWLSGGTVVYYSKFPKPGSDLDKTFVPANYYPKNWIALQ